MNIGDFGKLENRVRSGWSMSATRWVKTKPASLKSLESFGNGRCISNKISITDAKNMRPSEKIRAKWMLWRSLAPLQALFMLIFTHLVALIDHPEQSRLDAAKTGPMGEPPGCSAKHASRGFSHGAYCQVIYP